MRRFAWRALTIFALGCVLSPQPGILPIMVASLAGVFAMIAASCLNMRQAARTFDGRIFMLVAAALAGAVALEKTGGAEYLANGVVNCL